MVDLFGNMPFRALSWKQPFATAMLAGKQETRVWNTKYRGLVLICSSQAAYDEASVRSISGDELFVKLCLAIQEQDSLDMNGFAIAVGELVGSRPMRKGDEDSTFVLYRPELFVHQYTNVRPIKPFPWTGSQGWKTLDQNLLSEIVYI
jgi:hypothetical protein